MRVLGSLYDHRIAATSVLLEMEAKEYLRLVSGAEHNLDIQRAIVKGFKPYERLRQDLKKGCLIPPPVLALRQGSYEVRPIADASLVAHLEAVQPADIYIVDGLQRTNAIQQALRELNSTDAGQFLSRLMRVEIWPDISLSALTYRMILLNAAQKPMSLRHQVEVVSRPLCDALQRDIGPDIEIYFGKDAHRRSGPGQYQFSILATAFQAFLQKLPHVDIRNEIVEEITKLDALDTYSRTIGANDGGGTRTPTEEFTGYVRFLVELDRRLWGPYQDPRKDESADDVPSARTLLTRDTFHLGLAAAYSWCLEFKPDALANARGKLFTLLEASPPSSDPMSLARLDSITSGFKRKDNVGEQTRNVVFRGFQEFFRSEGATPFDRCWAQGA